MAAKDNTMLWVIGLGAAVSLAWLWKGGAARGKTGSLTYPTPGHGQKPATPAPLQYNPHSAYHTQGNAFDRYGGPWPLHHARGAGL